jgi:DNA gyrase subunit A
VVAAVPVREDDEVMIITNRGMLIRMPVGQISVIGRNTQGVRLIAVESREEQVVAVARVAETARDAGAAGAGDEGAGGPDDAAGDEGGDEGGAPGEAAGDGEGGPEAGGEPGGGAAP